MIVQVYKEALCRRQHAPLLSFPSLFRLCGYTGCLVLAYALAYSSGDMWLKRRVASAQPHAAFAYRAIAQYTEVTAEGVASRLWTTDSAVNALLGARAAVGTLQVHETDVNHDGAADSIHVTLAAADAAQAEVDLAMRGLVHVEHSSATPGMGLAVTGRLELRQQGALRAGARRRLYDQPILFSQNATDPYELGRRPPYDILAALAEYQQRNETTVLRDQSKVWKAGKGPFAVSIDMQVPHHQQILYRPQRFAEFKHGFVQWLASFIVIAAVFSRFEAILFRCRALDTYCTFDVRSTGFS